MANSAEWSIGYARQAAADFRSWNDLAGNPKIPECHRLLFLQMACEKLAKAHLCVEGTDPKMLSISHAYTAKNIPVIIRHQIGLSEQLRGKLRWIVQHTKPLAREIELLAPAVKRAGQRPDNCEYPWEDGAGNLHVPLDWTFEPTRLLTATAGRAFLKLIQNAIERFLP